MIISTLFIKLLIISSPMFLFQIKHDRTDIPILNSFTVSSADKIEMDETENSLIINIFTKTGIGKAEITKEISKKWPSKFVVVFNSIYMEGFTIGIDDKLYNISNTSENRILEEIIVVNNGKRTETIVENDSLQWIKVTHLKDKFKIEIPAVMLKSDDNCMKFSWIDQYR
jgi:hypothetical protein